MIPVFGNWFGKFSSVVFVIFSSIIPSVSFSGVSSSGGVVSVSVTVTVNVFSAITASELSLSINLKVSLYSPILSKIALKFY